MVPDFAADLVERVGRPLHDVEPVGAEGGVLAAFVDDIGDPLGRVRADQPYLFAALLPDEIEEPLERLLALADRRPDQPPCVVVDRDRQVAVALLVADLIQPDPLEPVERVMRGAAVSDDPVDDRSDRPPRDPQQLAQRRLRRVRHQPRRLVIERVGVPGVVARPRDLGDCRSVLGALHPRRLGLEEALHRPQIERPPPPPALTPVIPRSPRTAPPTPALRVTTRPDPRDHRALLVLLVLLDRLDHRRPVDTEHTPPYIDAEHAALPASLSGLSEVRKPRQGAARSPLRRTGHPRMSQESH